MHVARADLDRIRVLGDERDLGRVERLGDDREADLVSDAAQER
jgi:hypothetical protein